VIRTKHNTHVLMNQN